MTPWTKLKRAEKKQEWLEDLKCLKNFLLHDQLSFNCGRVCFNENT